MPFRSFRQLSGSTGLRVLVVALGWLLLISWLHYKLNFEDSTRPVIRMGYMPVITNLAAVLLDRASKDGTGLRGIDHRSRVAPGTPVRQPKGNPVLLV